MAIGLWGISCPTPHLTQAGCCLSLQLEQPVLRPGSAGDAPEPSFLLALAQPTATRISLLSREQPQETKLASGQTWGRGHKLFQAQPPQIPWPQCCLGPAQNLSLTPPEGALWLSKHLRDTLSQRR